jgi:glycosyltransferase involved in cell wall biosynthesis
MPSERKGLARVLIVYTGGSPIFPERDREILAHRFEVETFGFTGAGSWWELRAEMKSVDIVIFWFLGRAAYWGMLFPPRRPKIVSLIGGYEAARLDKVNYGSTRSLWRRIIMRRILRYSDLIIAVSEFTRRELQRNLGIDCANVAIVHNAIDTGYFSPGIGERKMDLVLMVAQLDEILEYIKGFDVLVETARQLPQVHFVIAGEHSGRRAAKIVGEAPPNIEFVGQISIGDLKQYYQAASVYFQPSRHESFGVSVIEAMSCGCIPVVSNRGALPEVVGQAGYVLENLDPGHAADVLRQALARSQDARDRARTRVVECFDVSLRAQRLFGLLDELVESRIHD